MSLASAKFAQEALMILYLAGPMSNVPHHNFPAFDQAKVAIEAMGHIVVSPADVNRKYGYSETDAQFVQGAITKEEYQRLFKLDVQEILGCEGIVLLPGWMESQGAKLEFALARMCGLKLYRFIDGIEPISREEYDPIIHVMNDAKHWHHDRGCGAFQVPWNDLRPVPASPA